MISAFFQLCSVTWPVPLSNTVVVHGQCFFYNSSVTRTVLLYTTVTWTVLLYTTVTWPVPLYNTSVTWPVPLLQH